MDDFWSLTRRELQTLCKSNGIPANRSNVFMADALAALRKQRRPFSHVENNSSGSQSEPPLAKKRPPEKASAEIDLRPVKTESADIDEKLPKKESKEIDVKHTKRASAEVDEPPPVFVNNKFLRRVRRKSVAPPPSPNVEVVEGSRGVASALAGSDGEPKLLGDSSSAPKEITDRNSNFAECSAKTSLQAKSGAFSSRKQNSGAPVPRPAPEQRVVGALSTGPLNNSVPEGETVVAVPAIAGSAPEKPRSACWEAADLSRPDPENSLHSEAQSISEGRSSASLFSRKRKAGDANPEAEIVAGLPPIANISHSDRQRNSGNLSTLLSEAEIVRTPSIGKLNGSVQEQKVSSDCGEASVIDESIFSLDSAAPSADSSVDAPLSSRKRRAGAAPKLRKKEAEIAPGSPIGDLAGSDQQKLFGIGPILLPKVEPFSAISDHASSPLEKDSSPVDRFADSERQQISGNVPTLMPKVETASSPSIAELADSHLDEHCSTSFVDEIGFSGVQTSDGNSLLRSAGAASSQKRKSSREPKPSVAPKLKKSKVENIVNRPLGPRKRFGSVLESRPRTAMPPLPSIAGSAPGEKSRIVVEPSTLGRASGRDFEANVGIRKAPLVPDDWEVDVKEKIAETVRSQIDASLCGMVTKQRLLPTSVLECPSERRADLEVKREALPICGSEQQERGSPAGQCPPKESNSSAAGKLGLSTPRRHVDSSSELGSPALLSFSPLLQRVEEKVRSVVERVTGFWGWRDRSASGEMPSDSSAPRDSDCNEEGARGYRK